MTEQPQSGNASQLDHAGDGDGDSAHATIAASEAQYRLLIGSLAQAVWETDAAGVVVADSPSWRAYTGQTLDEWLGYGWLDAIHPEDRAFAKRQWREAMAARSRVNAEFRLRARDGGWRWTNVRAAPVLDAEGGITKWAGMNIDIDARKRAEDALAASEEKYRTLFESIDEGFAVIEFLPSNGGTMSDFRFMEVNAAFERQTGNRDVTGKLGSEINPGEDAVWIEAFGAVARSGDPARFEIRHEETDRWYDVYASRAGAHDGRQVCVVFADTTERKAREDQQAFLLKLSDTLRSEVNADAVATRAIAMLLDQLALDRCYITYYRPADDAADFPYQIGNDTVPPLPATVRLSDFPDAYDQVCEKTYVIDDDFERRGLSETERANSKALGMRAMLASTIRQGEERPLASMVAVSSRPRHWTAGEIAMVEEAAERTWAAMERARSEAALRESEERRDLALEATQLGTFVWNIQQDRSTADARMLGLLDGQSAGLSLSEAMAAMIHPDDAQRYAAAVAVALQPSGSHMFVEDARIRRRDGSWRWLSITGRVSFGQDGQPSLMAGTALDVTERKHAEAALRESEDRHAFLLKLSDAVRPLFDSADIQGATTRLLREQLNAGWCYYVDWNLDRKTGLVLRDSASDGLPSLAGEHDVSDATDLLQLLASGEVLTVGDYANYEQLNARIRQQFAALGFRSMMLAPLVKEGRLIASMLVGDTEVRDWSASEVSLLVEAAERTRAALERARAEAALRESENLRRVALSGGRMGSWRWDRSADLIQGDAQFMALWGLPPSNKALPLAVFAARMSAKGAAEMAEIVGRALDLGEDFIGPLEIVSGPTAGRWVQWQGRAAPDDPSVLYGITFDITERKASEALLREREADLARVQQIGGVGGVDIDVAGGLRSRRSPEYLKLHGLPPDTREETHADWRARLHPDDREQAERALFAALDSDADTYALEYRIVRPNDGAVRWIAARADIERDSDGKAVRLVGAHVDITEQKRAQAALSESEERLRQFGDASQDVLWIRDVATLQWTYLTPAFEAIYGLDQDAALTGDNFRHWLDLIVPEDQQHASDSIAKVAAGEHVTFEYRIRRPSDGAIRWLRDTDFPITNAQGEVILVGGIGHDITDRRGSEDRQKMLLAELQHRVRNILAVIHSIVRRSDDDERSKEDYVLHLAGRISTLARTQVLLTRSAGASVNLEDMVRDELLAQVAKEEQFSIGGPEVELSPKAAEVLTLAIHELATNATKYGAFSRASGELRVEWTKQDREGETWLVLDWTERGVPILDAVPRRQGFGSELISRRIPYELKGRGSFTLQPGGLHSTIEFPLRDGDSILQTHGIHA